MNVLYRMNWHEKFDFAEKKKEGKKKEMYSKKNTEWLRHLDFEIVDLLGLELIYYLVTIIYRALVQPEYEGPLYVHLFIFIAYLMILVFSQPYSHVIQRGYLKELKAVIFEVVLCYSILIIGYYFAHKVSEFSRICISCSVIFTILILWGMHSLIKHTVRVSLSSGKHKTEMVVVSDQSNLLETLEHIDCSYHSIYHAKAAILISTTDKSVERMLENTEFSDITIISGLENGYEYLRKEVVDEIYIDSVVENAERDHLVEDFLAMGLVAHVAFGTKDSMYLNASMNRIGSTYVVTSRINDAYEWQLGVKRLVDICGAIVGLIITGFAAIFIVPAIKIADPGPAIFAQDRVGKNGRVFRFYKFRSMYMDAEERKKDLMDKNEMSGLMFKMENDPRIIGSEKGPGKGIGNFIRKTSLDELPQFWNILRGDMSLIGTRPPTLGEYKLYEPRHKIRLCMKPGLTGMWQVSGRSNITDFEEVVKLDTEYIKNWSMGLDIKIFFKTIKVVLHREGTK